MDGVNEQLVPCDKTGLSNGLVPEKNDFSTFERGRREVGGCGCLWRSHLLPVLPVCVRLFLVRYMILLDVNGTE